MMSDFEIGFRFGGIICGLMIIVVFFVIDSWFTGRKARRMDTILSACLSAQDYKMVRDQIKKRDD